jgi:hypothetical protein
LFQTETQPPSFFQRGRGFWLLIVALVIIVVAAAGLVLSCSGLLPVVGGPIGGFFAQKPSDEQMIREFKGHSAEFQELLGMIQADKGIQHIGTSPGDWQMDTGTASIPQARVAEYLRLMQDLRIEAVDRNGATIELTRASWGAFLKGWSKSYVFSEVEPSPLLKNTDSLPGEDSVEEAYRRIEGNWYIYHIREH